MSKAPLELLLRPPISFLGTRRQREHERANQAISAQENLFRKLGHQLHQAGSEQVEPSPKKKMEFPTPIESFVRNFAKQNLKKITVLHL